MWSGSCPEVLEKKSCYTKLVSCLSHCICVYVRVNNAELGQKTTAKSSVSPLQYSLNREPGPLLYGCP